MSATLCCESGSVFCTDFLRFAEAIVCSRAERKRLGPKLYEYILLLKKRECGKFLGGFTSLNNKALVIWIEVLCSHWLRVTFENHYVGKPRPEDTKEMGVVSLACQSDVWSSVLIKYSCKVNTLEAQLKRSSKVILRENAISHLLFSFFIFLYCSVSWFEACIITWNSNFLKCSCYLFVLVFNTQIVLFPCVLPSRIWG